MKRILVVLPNWYGETLFATPFLRALRQQRPEAFIATLGWPQCRGILLHNPHVNELLDYEERGVHRTLRGKWGLVRALRARRFDTAFILRNSLSRTVLMAAAGISTRVGFANPKSGWLLTRRACPATAQHKAASYLPLLEVVGLSATHGPYDYVVSDGERRAAQALLGWRHVSSGRPLVILHPGANWPHKRWAPDRFAALGDRLAATHAVDLAITGAPDDRPLAETIAQRMRAPATVLAGRTTLRELAGCLSHAALVVSNDTSIVHIAAALGRPLVALYGPTSPRLTGPLGDAHQMRILHHDDCCPRIPCYQPDRPPHPGMDRITVDEAYDAACQLLAAR